MIIGTILTFCLGGVNNNITISENKVEQVSIFYIPIKIIREDGNLKVYRVLDGGLLLNEKSGKILEKSIDSGMGL